jgi:hypothetical protein
MMEIYRLPKAKDGDTVANLVLSSTRWGKVLGTITVKGPMSAFSQPGEYDSLEVAEREGIEFAQRYRATILYIDDRT